MRLSFRLAQLVGYDPNPNRRSGQIKQISEFTGIYRHKVRDLLTGEFLSLKLDDLGRLCNYLREKMGIPADQLPGALFAVEPESFWEQLACRERLQFCYGVRREEVMTERSWVMASDALLYGVLLRSVSRIAIDGKDRSGEAAPATNGANGGDGAVLGAMAAPRQATSSLNQVQQSLVRAPTLLAGESGPTFDEQAVEMSRSVYDEFIRFDRSKALVCLGSMKSNPVCELVLASAFGAVPFAEDGPPATPGERRCPFYMRYRAKDPHPASCAGGLKLSQSNPGDTPGIWYETASGDWECLPSEPNKRDAAIVFYVNRPAQGRHEMVLGGFSGLATRLLANTLAEEGSRFWPPAMLGGVEIGAFLVDYEHEPLPPGGQDFLSTPKVESMKIIPLDPEVFQRRRQQWTAPSEEE